MFASVDATEVHSEERIWDPAGAGPVGEGSIDDGGANSGDQGVQTQSFKSPISFSWP